MLLKSTRFSRYIQYTRYTVFNIQPVDLDTDRSTDALWFQLNLLLLLQLLDWEFLNACLLNQAPSSPKEGRLIHETNSMLLSSHAPPSTEEERSRPENELASIPVPVGKHLAAQGSG